MDVKIMPKRIRDSVYAILQDLDSRMKNDPSTTFRDIYNKVQKVIELQKVYARKPVDRGQHMAGLLEWATRNGVNCSHINITNYGEFGYGLEAAKDILMGQEFLRIPKKLIFSPNQFLESELGHLAKKVHPVPGMLLTLALLAEMGKPDSFWSPYFDTLPSEYNMVLYFTPEDMELLSETSIQSSALKFYQIALKQYIEMYKLMEKEKDKSKLSPLRNFCFEDFRWAFCTVLTRQNTIRGEEGWEELAFIPLWDMCNHTWGQVSTSFVCRSETILSQAMMDFKEGEQIFIHYGDRSLREMFLYGGYVLPYAPSNDVPIMFCLDESVSGFEQKSRLLEYLGLPNQYCVNIGNILQPQCLAYLRVFCMPQELLTEFASDQKDVVLLSEHFLWLSIQHELDAYRKLYHKCQLAKKEFKCSREMDVHKVAECKSTITREIYRLRVEEKDILEQFLEFCHNHLTFLYKCKNNFEETANKSLQMFASLGRRRPFFCVNKMHCLNKEGHYGCCHVDLENQGHLMPIENRTIRVARPTLPLVSSENPDPVEKIDDKDKSICDEVTCSLKDMGLESKGFKKNHLKRFFEGVSPEEKESKSEELI